MSLIFWRLAARIGAASPLIERKDALAGLLKGVPAGVRFNEHDGDRKVRQVRQLLPQQTERSSHQICSVPFRDSKSGFFHHESEVIASFKHVVFLSAA